jgi:L,D-peptidoglycan transpeptidase YkuD (ErfK/YbiS/YcfS/YnhG family)
MKKPIFAAALLLSLAAGSLASSPALAVDATPPPPAQATETADASTAGAETPGTATVTPSPSATTAESPQPAGSVDPAPSEAALPSVAPSPSVTPTPTDSPAQSVTPLATVTPAPSVTPSPAVPSAPAPIVVKGAIGVKWRAMNGAAGALGAPVANEACSAGLCAQTFKGGTMYSTAATGAHPVLLTSGHTGPYWYANGRGKVFGYPVTDEVAVPGGTVQKMSTGRLVAWSGKGTYQVWLRGAIGSHWNTLGAVSVLGLPVSKETCGQRSGGCYQKFAKGYVYWSPASGARAVRPGNYAKWVGVGGLPGPLGYPVSSETCGQPAGGCIQRFQGGAIYWSAGSGNWVTKGGIGARYAAAGSTRSGLGYPTANEKCVPGQCIQSFQAGYIGWSTTGGTRIYSMTECAKLNNGRSRYPTYGANRVLLTFTQGYGRSYATNIYCVRVAGLYVADWKTDGYVGASGFKAPGVPSGPTRNLYSPTGSYSVTEAFGLGNPGTQLPYRTLNPRSRWGGNPWTATYNKYFESSSWVGWDENMWYFATRASHDYRQGVVINYNRPNIVQDAGFAIFLHMNKVPTAGCISLDDWAVVDYIKKSKPGDRIIMGTYGALFR